VQPEEDEVLAQGGTEAERVAALTEAFGGAWSRETVDYAARFPTLDAIEVSGLHGYDQGLLDWPDPTGEELRQENIELLGSDPEEPPEDADDDREPPELDPEDPVVQAALGPSVDHRTGERESDAAESEALAAALRAARAGESQREDDNG
jgi:hypothetical protein